MTGSSDRSEFDKIEIVDPPTSAKRIKRKFKKSVPFYEDPEILKRLAKVADEMLQGTPSWRIAEKLKVSLATAKRDVKRVREIWKLEATEKLDSLMGDALAQYQRVQQKAWEQVSQNPERADRYLAVILSAQDKLDKIAGIAAPEKLQVDVNGSVEVKDIERLREERWNQVLDAIREIKE